MTTIRLLGAPVIFHDGLATPPPRGRKAWALLAYLLLCERPVTRRELAELLFADAADPLGALRWNLAQLRRALGTAAVLQGDPVQLVLAVDVVVDVRDSGAVGGVLLEGREFAASPAFESWLLVARRRYSGRAEAMLRETALAELAAGRHDQAVELATRLVGLDPFDEGHHELLVRGLACSGDRAGALAQVAACRRLFRGELGCEPSPAGRRASVERRLTRAERLANSDAEHAAILAVQGMNREIPSLTRPHTRSGATISEWSGLPAWRLRTGVRRRRWSCRW